MSNQIRNSVKAIIEQAGRVLLIRKRGNQGDYFVFPGGGQDKFETMADALRRECQEEIGVDVIVRDLRFVREYVSRNHEFADSDPTTHQVEFYFSCDLPEGSRPVNGPSMDRDQLSVEWIAIEEIASLPVYPRSLRGERFSPSKIYCGDIN
ncbi:MAG TPA: NUDIX domain-containing protein [Opitutaceae bacterium]|nr:NUDIX domain-containing protein [Opitutaceae bacterium]